MSRGERIRGCPSRESWTFPLLFTVAVTARLAVWHLIPVDWNSDSYHHWQISYLSLKIGFPRGRMWDLNGCELYWGMVPHLVQAVLLWALSTTSIVPYRALNVLLGGVNSYLVYQIGKDNFHEDVGLYAGLLFALYPVSVVFDTIAMQETLALSFALLSIYLFSSRPGWSGFFLALACQSRIEYWLASMFFVLGVALVERFSTEIQSFVFSWLGVTVVFCTFFRNWTANPVYPLYWSLFNAFGGWKEGGLGLPFHVLMVRYAAEKLAAWSRKATGLLLLGSFAATSGVFLYTIIRRRERYHVHLFFFTTLAVFSPLFVPYYPVYMKSMLLMLRESIPIAAFGSILLCHVIHRIKGNLLRGDLRRFPLELALVTASLLSLSSIVPAYRQFQVDSQLSFSAADKVIEYYRGGTIVCDHPTMNYRFVSRWSVRASDLLGNHYSPHYYGVTEPLEYARWFAGNNVTLWIYGGSRAHPVYAVVSREMPGLLVLRDEVHGIRVFEVDRGVLEGILAG